MSKNTRKQTILSELSPKGNPAKLFVWAVSLSALIYTVIYFIIGNGSFANVFFVRCQDFFMDFFNSIRDASQGSAVYTERHVIYPPMANLIYLVLSRFTPATYNDTSFNARYTWITYFTPMMLVVIWCVICALIFVFIVHTVLKKGSSAQKFLVAALMFLSVPMMYLIERGNIIVLALIALMIYAFTYNSQSKWKREIGLIALAFSFSIKLYHIVFGWFLIADKRFKEALRCVIYSVLMLLIPSFFFGGPACFYQLFLNIFSFSSGGGSTLDVILNYINMPLIGQKIFTMLTYLWVLICGLCFAVSPFIRKDSAWKTWTVGLVTISCVPSLTSIYSWAFMTIPLIMLFNVNNVDKKKMTYAVMLIIPFMFLPLRFHTHVSTNTVSLYVMTAVLSIFCVIDTIIDLKRFVSEKKSEGITLGAYMKSLVKKDN